MRLLLVFSLLITHFFVYSQDTINQKDNLDRKQGHWIYYGRDRPEKGYPADAKIEEGSYVDDRKEGLWIKYHEDGVTPKLKGSYKNNRPVGPYVKTGPFNNVKETGFFIKNQNEDSLKRYYDSGQLEYEAFFNKNGKEDGRVNMYYPEGKLEFTYIARDGAQYEAIHYDKEGNVLFSNDKPVVCPEPTDKTPRKSTPVELPVNSGSNVRTSSNGGCGKKFESNGSNKVYNEDGEVWQDGVFKDGKLWDGKVYVYDHDGILLKVHIFRNGIYDHDGQL